MQLHPFFPDPVFAWTFFLVLVALTTVAAYIDLRTLTIPKRLTFLTLALGVVFSIVRSAWLGTTEGGENVLWFGAHGPWIGALDGLLYALVGVLFGFALFFIMWILGTCGGGDVKLFAAIGAWGGVTLTLWLLIGTIVYVVLLSILRLVWGVLAKGAKPTFKDYSLAGAATKGKRAGKQGYGDVKRTRRRLMAYSLSVALSVVSLCPWVFRDELGLTRGAAVKNHSGDSGQVQGTGEK
jgi:Flp pilus assembly protein protease CpaA